MKAAAAAVSCVLQNLGLLSALKGFSLFRNVGEFSCNSCGFCGYSVTFLNLRLTLVPVLLCVAVKHSLSCSVLLNIFNQAAFR